MCICTYKYSVIHIYIYPDTSTLFFEIVSLIELKIFQLGCLSIQLTPRIRLSLPPTSNDQLIDSVVLVD